MQQEEFLLAVSELKARGKSIRAIAEELGVNRGRVDRALKKLALSATEMLARQAGISHTADGTGRDLFVGRRHEMDELKAALEDALTGLGRLVMLVGEPGIGKTRTAAELSAYSRLRGARVMWGRCHESIGTPPYWVWMQIIRPYMREHDAHQLRSEMGATGAAAIAEIVPELREIIPCLESLPPFESAEQARFRLFDSITTFLRRASESQPLVLVLDNLHWADRSSLLLLEFLSQEIEHTRTLIVCTYRDEETAYGDPLSLTLGELTKERHFQRIILGGLDHEDLGNLIESVGGVSPPEALVGAVYGKTEGNPLFVTEVIRMLMQEGKLASGPVLTGERIELGIPEGVRDAIGRRLSNLSEGCNQALTTASVIGREFGQDLLDRVMEGLSREHLLEVLEEARSARIVEEVPDVVGGYQFSHALIRQTLAEELSASRRVRLHARIGEALEELYGPEAEARAAELAHHFAQAEPVLGTEKLVRYSLLAGERALAAYAYEEALVHFQRALAAKERQPMDAETAALLFGFGRAQLAEKSGASPLHPEAAEGLGRAFDYYVEVGDVPRALAVAEYPVSTYAVLHPTVAQLAARALPLVSSDSAQAGRL